MNNPADNKKSMTFANAHIAWLVCLGCLLHRVRCEGLMSIEWLIEAPLEEGSLFTRFPQVLEAPYLTFATDILRMMVGGNLNTDDMQVYAGHAIVSLMAGDGAVSPNSVDESLLKTIWLTLWAGMKGYAPQVALEFGRQAIPVKQKLTYSELEKIFKSTRGICRKSESRCEGLEWQIKSFIESLG